MFGAIPSGILSEKLHELIGGRRVKAAVFTTYQFDAGFFEEEVLPILFEQSFSHVPRIRLVQLEEALRGLDHLAVYYDRRGLVAGGTPARLDVRRIPLARRTGYFHPKLIMLLVEESDEEEYRDHLIVGCLSANLTRAGWWENVECGHVREFRDSSLSIRQDLLSFIQLIRGEERTGEKHSALEEIRKFIRYRLYETKHRSSQGVLNQRLFFGQQSLAAFLDEQLRLPYDTYNLEVISPYFDDTDEAGTLRALVEALGPKETRIFLPQADDGAALCRKKFFGAVGSLPGVKWGKLPRSCVQRAKSGDESQTDRFVHAKVYRIWSRAEEREYLLVGSANLTQAAHGRANAGNLEASVLIEREGEQRLRFWLEELINDSPTEFRTEDSEEGPSEEAVPPVTIRHLWDKGRTQYFWEGQDGSPPQRVILSSAGVRKHEIQPVVMDKWTSLPKEISRQIAKLLQSTSFLEVAVDDGPPCPVLVQEEGMEQKPSILLTLTAEEILRYWSLLSPEQREAFLSEKQYEWLVREGLAAPRTKPLSTQDSLFDKFAGIFHAFSRLEEHIRTALDASPPRTKEAVFRLFGKKYDSLPSLVQKVLSDSTGDPVNRYVTLLSARQIDKRLRSDYPELFAEHSKQARELTRQLEHIEKLRGGFDFETPEVRDRFFTWYERLFAKNMRPGLGT